MPTCDTNIVKGGNVKEKSVTALAASDPHMGSAITRATRVFFFKFARLYLVLFFFSSSNFKSFVMNGILALPLTLLYYTLAESTEEEKKKFKNVIVVNYLLFYNCGVDILQCRILQLKKL